MKKTIIHCIGNLLLFTLMGLAFLFPFSEVSKMEIGFQGSVTVFPFLLIGYLIMCPIVHYILAKKYHWKKRADSELAYSDEREKIIVAESTKISYQVLIGGLITTIAVIGGVKFFSLFTSVEISIYSTSITLLTVLLDIAAISYCIKWCQEYKNDLKSAHNH